MTRPRLFGLVILLGCGGGSATAFDEDRTTLGQDTTIFRDKEGRELTGKLLALSENTAMYYKDKELIIVGAGEPPEPPAPPLPSLPPNCSYLNLWSYYYRWTTAGQPVYDEPFTPNFSADPPLNLQETYLFAPPENISFATVDCGLSYDDPCIVPVGAVTEEGFGKVPVGKMIRSALYVNDVDSCSDEDIGYSTNVMIFLDPKVNAKTGIVQYQSSLAVYEFQAVTKKDCRNNSNVAAYPITGGTGLLLSASGSMANSKQVNVEREDGFFDMYFEYVYTVCTPHSVPPPGPPVPKSPKKGKGQRM